MDFDTMIFDSFWIPLSREGKCDGWGGMEYQRVYSEWIAEGKPPFVEDFIILHANGYPI